MLLSQENRPLKKPLIGPPEVYAQRDDQKEDRLSDQTLNVGYSNEYVCKDEHGSAKNDFIHNLKTAQIFSSLNTIIQKKTDYSTITDGGKKKPPVVREQFMLATGNQKSKQYIEDWMQSSLANSAKPLKHLVTRSQEKKAPVPIFNKREESIQMLCDFNVPNNRAAWYLKMAAWYNQSQNEAKKQPRRHLNDPGSEWTQSFTKFMSDLLQKMVLHYGGGAQSAVPGFLTAGNQIDIDTVTKHWNYCDKLTLYLYQEGLLDKQEYLSWAIDILEATKCSDENLLRLILAHVYQYIKDIVKQYLLSRKLAQFCANKLSQMTSSSGFISPRSTSPHFEASTSSQQLHHPAQLSILSDIWLDYLQCGQHRSTLLMLCSMIQSVVLACPSALVWLNLGEGKSSFIQPGSPLDQLPCHPCTLPMAPGEDLSELRKLLRKCELEISRRSMAAELSWSSDKVQQSMTGFITGKLLSILDKLDEYNFDTADTSPAINKLYTEIMAIWEEKTSSEPFTSLEPLIFLLCDWVITNNRMGDYRPLVVAMLLEKHQTELWNAADDDNDDSEGSTMQKDEDNIFHDLLLKYLDKKAPVLDENNSEINKRQFANCVALFAELIRLEIFSHDVYLCTLISRGDLNQSTNHTSTSNAEMERNLGPSSVLKGILESDDASMTSGAAASSYRGMMSADYDPVTPVSAVDSNLQVNKQSRHLQYVTHFPIPQEDTFSHECNQRAVVLFGVGKGRENSKHQIKRVTKDLQRLFSKKCSIDVATGDAGKVKQRTDQELDQALTRFQALTYYDQYAISGQVMEYIIEAYDQFVTKTSSHVPMVEHIMFFIDLVESSLNIKALIDFCEKLVNKMNAVDFRIRQIEAENKQPMFVGKYTQHIIVYIVAVLKAHFPSLLLHPKTCCVVFEAAIQVVGELRHVAQCSSAQRCILLFLLELYQSSHDVRGYERLAEFAIVASQIQDAFRVKISPVPSTGVWSRTFMTEYLQNFNVYKFRLDAVFNRKMSDNRTSFVNNVVYYLCQQTSFERVNEVALMCAEFTAQCSYLAADWLGVLKALCCSSVPCGYVDLLAVIDVSKMTTQQCENIAIFYAILIARHCISLTDFFQEVALSSLTRPVINDEQRGESGARLTLHILLRVFKANTSLKEGLLHRNTYIKSSCDLHLLAAANQSIQISPLLAILKSILVLASRAKQSGRVKDSDLVASLGDAITDEDDDEGGVGARGLSVGRQAKQVLVDICNEDWVREKFLQDPSVLLNKGELKDKWLEPEEGWKLVQLICRRRTLQDSQQDNITDFSKQQSVITRILRTLDQWTIRTAWLELQLMHTWQNPDNMEGELSLLLDNIARATIEVFHSYTGNESDSGGEPQKEGVWLVAPLIARLSPDVQGRVLQSAALVLEESNKLWQQNHQQSARHRDRERENSMSLLNHQPFLSLVLTCLKGNDEKREGTLNSLQSQLEKFVDAACEDSMPLEPQLKQTMYEALQLRLSLVGGMFDTIQRTRDTTQDWAMILNRLIFHNIVDIQSNSELFYTVLDMLSALIHSTLVSDSAENVESSKKPYHVLIKKIKKEIGDKQSENLTAVRQLMPIPKYYVGVIACESHSSLLDAKGNKIQGFESLSKKSGLQIATKHKISPWEILEGSRNPAPLALQWFGAVKMERKMLGIEEQQKLMVTHNHKYLKEDTDFLAPPRLPTEDVDTMDITEDDKPDGDEKVSSLASSVPVPKTAGGKIAKRRPSRTNSATSVKSPYSNQRYESRMAAPVVSATTLQHTGWSSQPRGVSPGFNTPYFGPGPTPGTSGMNRMAPGLTHNMRGKEALEDMMRNRGVRAGAPSAMHTQSPAMPGYSNIDMTRGQPATTELLKNHLLKRNNPTMSGSIAEYEPPPPQYPQGSASQYGGRSMPPQGYHAQASYGPPPPNQGMMMRGQQPHTTMMSYNQQPGMTRYSQGGQPPPGGSINSYNPGSYQQPVQYQQDSRMMPQSQYMQRPGGMPPQSSGQQQYPPNNQYYQ